VETPVGIRKTPLVILVVAVSLASVVLGVFFGFLAGAGYVVWHGEGGGKRPVEILLLTGSTTGGVGGLLAGLLWCRVMFRKALVGESGGTLAATGGRWGLLVGVATAVLLHVVLVATLFIVVFPLAIGSITQLIGIGLACGVVAGGLLGLLSGAVWAWLAKRTISHGFPVDVSPPGK